MGKVLTLKLESTTHMCDVRLQIQNMEGTPPHDCRLMLGGKELDSCNYPDPAPCTKSCRQLQDYSIGDGATLYIVLGKKRGGPSNAQRERRASHGIFQFCFIWNLSIVKLGSYQHIPSITHAARVVCRVAVGVQLIINV